jgi:hypothetical protein
LVLQDAKNGLRGLTAYKKFESFEALKAPESLVSKVTHQRKELSSEGDELGDGAIVRDMVNGIGDALVASPEFSSEDHDQLREHATWLWNTYSGCAHTLSWPRMLPASGDDPRMPGDYTGISSWSLSLLRSG